MTMPPHDVTEDADALNSLLAVAKPAVDDADRLTSNLQIVKTNVVFTMSPAEVIVLQLDAGGRARRVHREPGDEMTAAAIGGFVTAGLKRIDAKAAQLALDLVNRGAAELCVVLDVDLGRAGVALVPRPRPGGDDVELATSMVLLVAIEGKPTLH